MAIITFIAGYQVLFKSLKATLMPLFSYIRGFMQFLRKEDEFSTVKTGSCRKASQSSRAGVFVGIDRIE